MTSLVWTSLAAGLGLALAAPGTHAQAPDAWAVPTYESVGLYWANPGIDVQEGCEVKFRKVGAIAWTESLALWFDPRDNQCRGSLVHLPPNTDYEAQLRWAGAVAATRTLPFRTWSNQMPILKTVMVPGGTATLNIIEGGSAAGYVVYQGAPGAVLDANNAFQFNVIINASRVILRGLTLRGAIQDAIRISPGAKDVVIEDNDISGWGRQRSGAWGVDMDSGIRAVCSLPTIERVTIQRNRIHDPRYGANSWSDGHPAGPQAVTFSNCGGNHVIRHNEMYSTAGHYFNDVIGGEENFSRVGFPYSDSDVYGNILSHAWDDGIESEGANENVRIWGNYIDRTATGIATTVTSVGPLYIFRNVWNRSQFFERGGLDADDRQAFFKAGSDSSLGSGRRYVFHNTMLQATQAGLTYPLGGGFGIGGTGITQPVKNTISRNNIYHLWKPNGAFYQTGSGDDAANDMYSGTAGDIVVVNGVNATPVYAAQNGWASEAGGRYQLAPDTPGYDQGLRIPGFNDRFLGAGPDIGAHEGGAAPMVFGIAASPGPAAVLWLGLSPSALDFGGQSMGTRSPPQRLIVSNNALTSVVVTSVTASGPFRITNGCAALSPGASCAIDVTFEPPAAAGALNSSVVATGTITIASDDPGSPRLVGLLGVAEKSLVTHYYRSILRRSPDAAGKAFWEGEAARVAGLGANLSEAWYAMAAAFYASLEYAALARSDPGFVSDLYTTFLNRAPDPPGLAYWTGQISAGLPRAGVLVHFMFSAEFADLTRATFGNTAARAEVDMVMDFYRGFLERLPDSGGFDFYVRRMRTAQCSGAGAAAAVDANAESISSTFASSPEYAAMYRTTAEYVANLYNAFLRRGPDLAGLGFWVEQLATGARSRERVRQDFKASDEFSARIARVAAQGCLQ